MADEYDQWVIGGYIPTAIKSVEKNFQDGRFTFKCVADITNLDGEDPQTEIDKFNAKWESKFKDSPNWAESKHYGAYIKAYADLQATEMDKALRANPQSKFTTKSGKEYTARFLKESGNIVWGSNEEWAKYDKQK